MCKGHEVEHVEVGVVGIGTIHGDHVLGGIVSQPAVQNIRADGGFVDLAALDHLGAVHGSLGVVNAADGVDKDIVRIIVLGVLLHDPGFQRLVIGQVESTAAVQGLGAGGILVAHLAQQGAVSGLIGQVAQQAQEAGEIVSQGVGQGVVIHSGHAHRIKVHGGVGGSGTVCCGHSHVAAAIGDIGGAVIVHSAVFSIGQVDVIVVVIIRTGNVGGDQAHVGGSVIRGQHILQGIHKVLCGHGGNDFAVVVHPVLLAQGEGPGQGVGIPLPLGGQALAHHALVVVLDQGVHAVCTHDHFQVGGGGQVVQGCRLAGIKHGVLAGIRTGSRTGGAAAALTAAAGQQTGGAGTCGCQAACLEELTTRNRLFHNEIPSFLRVEVWLPPKADRPAVSRQREAKKT